MPIKLPPPIDRYFTAESGDEEFIARCFTEHAVVKDEGQTYNGLAAIKQWKAASAMKYTYTSEAIACEDRGSKTIVTSRVTGNFPGSPVDLRFFFGLENHKIASLEITL